MSDCLFCQIIDEKIPADRVYEDEHVVAFCDINPQAPLHVLIVPRHHIPTLNDLGPEDKSLVGHMHVVAAQIAAEKGVAQAGYRTLINCNAQAGQTVFHLHLHLLGGRDLSWPPG